MFAISSLADQDPPSGQEAGLVSSLKEYEFDGVKKADIASRQYGCCRAEYQDTDRQMIGF